MTLTCSIFVKDAASFSINVSPTEVISLAPGINNIPSNLFDSLASHPDIEMFEGLGWLTIYDGRTDSKDNVAKGLSLAEKDGEEVPVSDVNANGQAKVRKVVDK